MSTNNRSRSRSRSREGARRRIVGKSAPQNKQTNSGEGKTGSSSTQEECRICFSDASDEALASPCGCRGSSAFIHYTCLAEWYRTRADWDSLDCPTCKQPYEGSTAIKLGCIGLDEVPSAVCQGSLLEVDGAYEKLQDAMVAAVLRSCANGNLEERLELLRLALSISDGSSRPDGSEESSVSEEEQEERPEPSTEADELAERDRLEAKIARLKAQKARLKAQNARLKVGNQVIAEMKRMCPDIIRNAARLEVAEGILSDFKLPRLQMQLPQLTQDDAFKILEDIKSCLSAWAIAEPIAGATRRRLTGKTQVHQGPTASSAASTPTREAQQLEEVGAESTADSIQHRWQHVACNHGFEGSGKGVLQMLQAVAASGCAWDASSKIKLVDELVAISTMINSVMMGRPA